MLVKGIALYAFSLQKVISADSTSSLDSATKETASQISAAAKTGGFLAGVGPGSNVPGVLVDVMEAIIRIDTYSTVRTFASANQDNIEKIVSAIKALNVQAENDLSNDQNEMSSEFDQALKADRKSLPRVVTMQSVLEVETFINSELGTTPGQPDTTADTADKSLDQIVLCNKVVAQGGADSGHICPISTTASAAPTNSQINNN